MKDLSWLASVRAERLSGSTRNPGFAALLSFFVMGLGQIYAGHVDRGLFFIVVQLSGGFCGYSLYSKGIVYEALMGYLTQGALISLVYVFSVVLILLWIYNIKDAYYLSLFAGFRDWFEIERMVIPMLTNYKTNLIAYDGPQSDADSTREDTIEVKQIKKNPPSEEKDVEDAIPAYVSKKTRTKKSPSGPASKKVKRKPEGPPPSLAWNLDFRFYGAFAAILILCGLIFLKNYMSASTKEEKKDEPGAFISLNQDFSLSLATETVAMIATKTEAIATLSSEEALINGIALVKNGSFSTGAEEIEKVMQVREVKPEVWRALMEAYRALGQSEIFEQTLRKYLVNFPMDLEGWTSLGKLLYDRRDYVEATRVFTKALEIKATHPRANFFMGSIYRELGMSEDAIPFLTRCLGNDPLNPEYNRELGAAYLDARNFRQARRFLEKVLSVSPQDDAARGLLAQLDGLSPPQGNLLFEESKPLSGQGFRVPTPTTGEVGRWGPDGEVFKAPSVQTVPSAFVALAPIDANKTEKSDSKGFKSSIIFSSATGPQSNPNRTVITREPSSPMFKEFKAPLEEVKPIYDPPPSGERAQVGGPVVLFDAASITVPIIETSSKPESVPIKPPEIVPTVASAPLGTASESQFGKILFERTPKIPTPTTGEVGRRRPDGALQADPTPTTGEVGRRRPDGEVFKDPAEQEKASAEKVLKPELPEKSVISETLASQPEVKVQVKPASEPMKSPKVEPFVEKRKPGESDKAESAKEIASKAKFPVDKFSEKPSVKVVATHDAEISLADAIAIEEDPAAPDFKIVVKTQVPGEKLKKAVIKSENTKGDTTAKDREELGKLYETGRKQYLEGNWDAALPHFLSYLKKKENPVVYDFVGHTFEKLGLFPDAFDAAHRAYLLGKKDSSSVAWLGQLAEKSGNFAKGAEILREAVSKNPKRVDLRIKLAKCLREMGENDASLQELKIVSEMASGAYSIQRRVEIDKTLGGRR